MTVQCFSLIENQDLFSLDLYYMLLRMMLLCARDHGLAVGQRKNYRCMEGWYVTAAPLSLSSKCLQNT